jgi:hypothetical protein
MNAIDRSTLYAFRAALVAVLRMVEDLLSLDDEARLLKAPKRARR